MLEEIALLDFDDGTDVALLDERTDDAELLEPEDPELDETEDEE